MPIDAFGQAVGSIVTELGAWLPQPKFRLTLPRPALLRQHVAGYLDVLEQLHLDVLGSAEPSIEQEQRAGTCWLQATLGLSVCTSIESPESGPLIC